MEKIRDLLQSPAPGQAQAPAAVKSLPIHEDRTRGVYVKGLTEEYVSSRAEIEALMEKGSRARAVGKTRMNAESSRSHAIFTISVGQKNTATNNIRTGKLSLVDLAGSEKVNKTGVVGQSLEEAKKINQSLSALGMVINALASRAATATAQNGVTASPTATQSHVPYRDSKLTRILAGVSWRQLAHHPHYKLFIRRLQRNRDSLDSTVWWARQGHPKQGQDQHGT